MLARVMGVWMGGPFTSRFWRITCKAALHYNKIPWDIVFQQDNDPKHACKEAQNWFQGNDM